MLSNNKKLKLIICGVILLLANNCSTSPHVEGKLREYIHQNGLIIKVPEEYAATANNDGFIVELADGSNKNRRHPIKAEVDRRGLGETPVNVDMQQKTIGNRTIKYRIEKREGGSGGDEYNFSAYENFNGELISYSQSEQSENSPPRFDLIWTIIENTSLKN